MMSITCVCLVTRTDSVVLGMRCTKCKEKECADSAPVSDSVPLRVLDLYILAATPMDSPHLIWLRSVSHAKGKLYDYNDAESEAIWCYSCSYGGKPQ